MYDATAARLSDSKAVELPMSYWVVLAPVVAGTAALGEVGAGATVLVRAAVPAGTMLWRRTIRWPL